MDAIGPYRIQDGPFRGGMGEVYRVYDTSSGDEFALKTLHGSFLSTADHVRRFREEIEVWSNIPVHPNVVRAIRAFEHVGRRYLVVEWVSGGNLGHTLQGPLPSPDTLEVMRQLCDGMGHIHRQGLVHGDLKPSNVMMWGGESPQITDFGLARAAGERDPGSLGGTERYFAPEARSGLASISADIYAAGVIFLEMLEPFRPEDFGVSDARALAHTMIREDPVARPTTFDEVKCRLTEILEAAPVPPVIMRRTGDRRTWDEQHADAVPAWTSMNEVRSLHASGRQPEARSRLAEVIAKYPERLEARTLMAHFLVEDGEADSALEQLRAARRLAADNPEELVSIGLLMVEIGQFDEATEVCDELPETAQLWYLRACIDTKKGSLSDAIVHYRKAVALGGDANVRLGLAIALKEAGLIEPAITELLSIGRDHPDIGIKVMFQLARIYVDLERVNDASRELRDCIRRDLDPGTRAYAYSELGYLYKEQQLYEAAISSYEKGLKLQPRDRILKERLALCREALAGSIGNHDVGPAMQVRHAGSDLDARIAYATLTEIEKRLEDDRLEDICEGIHRVGWSLLKNEHVVPLLLKTGRISEEESQLLHRIRIRPRLELDENEDIPIYPNIYELLLIFKEVFEMFDPRLFRGNPDCRSGLIPSLLRTVPAEIPYHNERTRSFVRRLATLEPYRRFDTAEFDSLLGFVAVAEHCGMPTTMLEFTQDVRIAASLATARGRLGQVGEIVVLHPRDLESVVQSEVNPYGRLISAAPTPSIEKRKGRFLAGAIPAVLHDSDTTFVEPTYRFRQDGRPFPAAGGYGAEEVVKGVRELVEAVNRTEEDPKVSAALQPQLERYFASTEEVSFNTSDRASDEEYECACVSFLGDLMSDGSSSTDRTVTAVYLRIQKELRDQGLQKHFVTNARGTRRAMEGYLSTSGSLEQRFIAGVQQAWLSRMPNEEDLLMEIVNRHVAAYFNVV
jgi:serine/threonine protein kinase